MPATTSQRETNKRRFPNDCLICAIRPALYLSRLNICIARFYCYHTNPSSKPQFRPSKFFKCLHLLCGILLIIGIINDSLRFQAKLSSKHILIILEIIFTTLTLMMNIVCFKGNELKIKEYHGLMSLLSFKSSYGLPSILTSSNAKSLYMVFLFLLLLACGEELVTFLFVISTEDIDGIVAIRMLAIEGVIFSNLGIGMFAFQFLTVYYLLFNKCFDEIKNSLDGIADDVKKRAAAHINSPLTDMSLVEKLRKFQRLYMGLGKNFKLNEDFMQPWILMIYSIDVCLLLIGYSYFVVMLIRNEAFFEKFDYFILIKTLAIILAYIIFCMEAEMMYSLSQDVISFLFKYPISKLSPSESAQIELLITTLLIQKPNLKASDIFTVGTGLLASIGGTVVTYVLVALQFHAILRK